MPWAEGSKTINEDKIVSQILDRARLLESDPDIVRCSQEAVEYYDSKRNLIVLNNWEAFKHRPEYTAEIVGTPRERA
jgi:hypothetical protein